MSRRSPRGFLLLSISLVLAGLGAGQLAGGAWIHAKAQLAQHLLDAAWQETRAPGGEAMARPWPWADTWPVARLVIPRLGASFVVLSGDSGSSLAFGPGHNSASVLPGHPGTAVISGHRDTHFSALARLRTGDRIEIERPDGVTVAYRITALEIADTRRDRLALGEIPRAAPSAASAPNRQALRGPPQEPAPARFALALVTCWPFDAVRPGGPMRYVVSAHGVGVGGADVGLGVGVGVGESAGAGADVDVDVGVDVGAGAGEGAEPETRAWPPGAFPSEAHRIQANMWYTVDSPTGESYFKPASFLEEVAS